MAEQQFEYKGHIIIVDEEEHTHPLLKIDGMMIHVHHRHRPNGETRFHAMTLCYVEYPTLLKLGKKLIDAMVLDLSGGGGPHP